VELKQDQLTTILSEVWYSPKSMMLQFIRNPFLFHSLRTPPPPMVEQELNYTNKYSCIAQDFDLRSKHGRPNRGLIDIVGKFYKELYGVATTQDINVLHVTTNYIQNRQETIEYRSSEVNNTSLQLSATYRPRATI
jgi:hypothetical protein